MTEAPTMPPRAAQKLAEVARTLLPLIEQDVFHGSPADQVMAGIFRARREFGSRDRRFLSSVVYGYFRWRGWFDVPAPGLHEKHPPGGLETALAYLLDADAPHPSADILLHEAGKKKLKPLGQETLSKKAQALDDLLERPAPRMAEELLPAWVFPALYRPRDAGEDVQTKVIQALQMRPPTWVRFRGKSKEMPATFPEGVIPHPDLPRAWQVENQYNVHQQLPAKDYLIEVQDLASQKIGFLCDPGAGETWWDACAGAGGKALHLADLMNNQGRIFATDIRKGPLKELRRRTRKAEATCVRGFQLDVEKEVPRDVTFDGVLVDAPCTGLGTWARNPDARWRMSNIDLQAVFERQLKILTNAAQSVRPGGKLIYSVCTLTEAETVRVTKAFLAEHPKFVREQEQWTWPWEGPGNGMYACLMTRTAAD